MLILDIPSDIRIKSVRHPHSSKPLSISAPVNPAVNPRAVLSMPRFFSTRETFTPFPPGYTNSFVARFTRPSVKSSTLTM